MKLSIKLFVVVLSPCEIMDALQETFTSQAQRQNHTSICKFHMKINALHFQIFLGNINEYLKGIGLRAIFRNILQDNDKVINFFDNFLYFL